MSAVNTNLFNQSLLRRTAHALGLALVEWSRQAEREQVHPASRLSPEEIHRRHLHRREAERRREEVILRVLTGPRQY